MRTVGAYDAKTNLSRLLDEVSAGQTIVITKHGVPVAHLTPPPAKQRPDAAAAVQAWREYRHREQMTLGDLSIRELIDEGRME